VQTLFLDNNIGPISWGENATQAAKNKQSACETGGIVVQPTE